jgi:hypothetical protein
MKSFGGSDRADLSEIILDVTLRCVQPQEALARAAGKVLAQSRLVGQSRQGRAEFFARPVHQSPAGCIDRSRQPPASNDRGVPQAKASTMFAGVSGRDGKISAVASR